MIKPAIDITDSFSGLKGLPLTASSPISRSLPPSRAGNAEGSWLRGAEAGDMHQVSQHQTDIRPG